MDTGIISPLVNSNLIFFRDMRHFPPQKNSPQTSLNLKCLVYFFREINMHMNGYHLYNLLIVFSLKSRDTKPFTAHSLLHVLVIMML